MCLLGPNSVFSFRHVHTGIGCWPPCCEYCVAFQAHTFGVSIGSFQKSFHRTLNFQWKWIYRMAARAHGNACPSTDDDLFAYWQNNWVWKKSFAGLRSFREQRTESQTIRMDLFGIVVALKHLYAVTMHRSPEITTDSDGMTHDCATTYGLNAKGTSISATTTADNRFFPVAFRAFATNYEWWPGPSAAGEQSKHFSNT